MSNFDWSKIRFGPSVAANEPPLSSVMEGIIMVSAHIPTPEETAARKARDIQIRALLDALEALGWSAERECKVCEERDYE